MEEEASHRAAADDLVHHRQHVVVGVRAFDRLSADEQVGLDRARTRDEVDLRLVDRIRLGHGGGHRHRRLRPPAQLGLHDNPRLEHRHVAGDGEHGAVGQVVRAMERDEIVPRQSIERRERRGDPRRGMRAVDGARKHFRREKRRVRALLREASRASAA